MENAWVSGDENPLEASVDHVPDKDFRNPDSSSHPAVGTPPREYAMKNAGRECHTKGPAEAEQ